MRQSDETSAHQWVVSLIAAHTVLRNEVDRYNNRQAHSTTKKIPSVRFKGARAEGSILFGPFPLPSSYISPTYVFCLRETRLVNGYRRISLFNHSIEVPHAPLREYVDTHLVPDVPSQLMEIRIARNDKAAPSAS